MPNPRRPRAGRLRAVRALLTLMLVGNVLYLVGAALSSVDGQIFTSFDVPVDVVYGPQPYLLRQANLHLLPLRVEVHLEQPSVLQSVLGLLSQRLAHAVATLPMIIVARRLVDRVAATDPFTPSTVRGLRRLGLVVLIGGLLAELVRSAAAVALYVSAVPDGHPFYDVDWRIDFWWLLLGLVILAFAQVVEHGCVLRDELDAVI